MKRIMLFAVTTVAALIASTVAVNAAPPSNDDIADAIALSEGLEQRFTTLEATVETGEDYCGGPHTVHYSFTAPSAGEYAAYVEGSDHDTEVGWNNAIDDATDACSDDSNDSYDAVTEQRSMTAGEQEYVEVTAHSEDEGGHGSVGVTEVVGAADDFADATTLAFRDGAATAVIGLEVDGTEATETGESTTCGANDLMAESAWLNFTPPESGTWMIMSKSGDETDIAVYTGSSVDDLSLLNCAQYYRLAVSIDTVAGTTYRVRIGTSAVTEPIIVRAEKSPTPMTAELVDADGDGTSTDVGDHSDLAFVDGEPAIAYYDETNAELRYAARSGGSWTDIRVDADGDGTSADVGYNMSIAVGPDGEPAIAYYDSDNGELRYASRTGGTWTDQLVDSNGGGASTDVGTEPSLMFLANGNPAIAYEDDGAGELRYAERSGGSWSDVLVDDDGDGTSTNTGASPSLLQYPNGDLGIGYVDDDTSQVRFAKRIGATWSDELVHQDPFLGDIYLAGAVLDSNGNPIVAINVDELGNHLVALWNGTSWDTEADSADRHLAELDFGCSYAELVIDSYDTLYLPWTDCNSSYYAAMSVRDSDGNWSVHDISAEFIDPNSSGFGGNISADDTWEFGAAIGPDGRLAVTLQLWETSDLWFAQEALVASVSGDSSGPAATDLEFDGSDSVDGWGSIASFEWLGAPKGCTFSSASAVSPTLRCVAPTSGSVWLKVTDTDGFWHKAAMDVLVTNAECDTTPDPFGDVPSSSFAITDVTCIYNLGVTTGTSGTTYSPSDNVTREQMASFLARLYKAVTGTQAPIVATPFTDVSATSFAKDDIARIFGLGITTGTSGTTYSPDDSVTREQMASFMARLFKAIRGEQAPVVSTPFTDVSATSFAKDDIARIFGLEITTGTSATTYDPAGNVTREQMAAFLARLYRAD